jgi:hypothetical protein
VQLFDEVFEGDTPPQFATSLVLMLLDSDVPSRRKLPVAGPSLGE